MKINLNISVFKAKALVFIGLLLLTSSVIAQQDLSEMISNEANLKINPLLKLNFYELQVEVLPSGNQTAKIEFEYIANGKQEELDKLKANIEKSIFNVSSGGGELNVDLAFQNNFDLEIMGMKWSKLKFKSSNETIKLKAFKVISCKLWLPSEANVDLTAKYSQLQYKQALQGNLSLNLYDAEARFQEVAGSVKGDVKYSKLNIAATSSLDLELYESKLYTDETASIKLDAKYSTIETGESATIDLEIYEGSFSGSDVGKLNVISKYADMQFGVVNDGYVEAYEGSINADVLEKARLTAKYIEFKAEKVKSFVMHEGYENEIKIGVVESVESKAGKYNELTIQKLEKAFIHSGYEDEIHVAQLASDFQKVDVSGKYVEADIVLANPRAHTLSGVVQYPDIDIDKAKYSVRREIGDSDKIEFNYEFGQVTEASPSILINGYEIQFKLMF